MVEGDVHVIGVLAHHHGVALAERASSHILAADPNVEACWWVKCKAQRDIQRFLNFT